MIILTVFCIPSAFVYLAKVNLFRHISEVGLVTFTEREKEIKMSIIALYADVLNGDEWKCLKLGFNDHVFKPITLKSLQNTLIKY